MNNTWAWLTVVTIHPWWDWWFWFTLLALGLLLLVRCFVWWQVQAQVLDRVLGAKKSFFFKRFQSKPEKNIFDFKSSVKAQLPLFLRTLGSTLKVGYSVPQALEFTAQETEEPLRSKLRSGVKILHLRQPLAAVLEEWKVCLKVPEFYFLADTLQLQSRTGGNSVQVCYAVAQMLEEREKLERDIKSFTAQGKMSGLLMALLWPISLLLFAWLSPAHTDILFQTKPGQLLLGISLVFELIGFFLIWRLVRLKI